LKTVVLLHAAAVADAVVADVVVARKAFFVILDMTSKI